jgi:hypothetical protein
MSQEDLNLETFLIQEEPGTSLEGATPYLGEAGSNDDPPKSYAFSSNDYFKSGPLSASSSHSDIAAAHSSSRLAAPVTAGLLSSTAMPMQESTSSDGSRPGSRTGSKQRSGVTSAYPSMQSNPLFSAGNMTSAGQGGVTQIPMYMSQGGRMSSNVPPNVLQNVDSLGLNGSGMGASGNGGMSNQRLPNVYRGAVGNSNSQQQLQSQIMKLQQQQLLQQHFLRQQLAQNAMMNGNANMSNAMPHLQNANLSPSLAMSSLNAGKEPTRDRCPN